MIYKGKIAFIEPTLNQQEAVLNRQNSILNQRTELEIFPLDGIFKFDVGSFMENVSSNRGYVGSVFSNKHFKNNYLYKLNQLNRLNQHLIAYLIEKFF